MIELSRHTSHIPSVFSRRLPWFGHNISLFSLKLVPGSFFFLTACKFPHLSLSPNSGLVGFKGMASP